jgi:phospholipid/cholesterol/gamma-HCH transport system substrate-binding protein
MKTRNLEILVGAFTLAGLAVIIVGIFVIRGLGAAPLIGYHALYANAAGVEDGTPVKYNGMLVGRVQELRIDEDDRSKVRVSFEVRVGTPVTTRTVAKITKADILGDPYIDLHQLEPLAGQSQRLDAPEDILAEGSRVLAGEPFDLQATLDDAAAAIESLSSLAALVKRQVEALIEDIRNLLQGAEKLLSDENRARVEETLARLADTSREIEGLVVDNRAHLDVVLANAEASTQSLRSATQQIDESLDDLLPEGQRLLAQTRETMGEMQALVERTKETMTALDVQQLNDLLSNLEATSRNLSEFSRDLKDRPYRLLRPEKPQPSRFPK